jgi:ABC-type dipeptide/oligopeptide/nickel transport system ATPase component
MICRQGDTQAKFYEDSLRQAVQRVVYEADSDLVIGVVGESFSGKFFTVFGATPGQLELTDESTILDFDMSGILERTADELL